MKYLFLLLLTVPLYAQNFKFVDTLAYSEPMQMSLSTVLKSVRQVDYLVLNPQIQDTLAYDLPEVINISHSLNELSAAVFNSGPKSYIYISSYTNDGLISIIEWRSMIARASQRNQELRTENDQIFTFEYL